MRLLLTLTVILIGLVACTDELQQNTSSSGTNGGSQTADRATTDGEGSSNQSAIVISAKDLTEKHRENQLRFKRDYSGKWVKVTGTVEYITEDSVGLRELGHLFSALKALPPQPGWPDLVMVATVDKSITATCQLDESSIYRNYYSLEGCHIQKGDAP